MKKKWKRTKICCKNEKWRGKKKKKERRKKERRKKRRRKKSQTRNVCPTQEEYFIIHRFIYTDLNIMDDDNNSPFSFMMITFRAGTDESIHSVNNHGHWWCHFVHVSIRIQLGLTRKIWRENEKDFKEKKGEKMGENWRGRKWGKEKSSLVCDFSKNFNQGCN